MSDTLYKIIAKNRAALEDEVFVRLNTASTLHNHPLDDDLLRHRVMRLVENLIASLQNKPEIFISYVESITNDRIEEGVVLEELQVALIALENKTWQIIVTEVPLEEQVRCVGIVTLVIGTAKDRVANLYLHHLEMVESEASFLRRRSGFLVRGTDSGPVTEDDLNWQRGSAKPPHDMV